MLYFGFVFACAEVRVECSLEEEAEDWIVVWGEEGGGGVCEKGLHF